MARSDGVRDRAGCTIPRYHQNVNAIPRRYIERSIPMSRLMYIAPVKVDEGIFERGIQDQVRPENTLEAIGFARGTRHLEYHYYEALATPDIVHTVIVAERQGFDAAI